MQRTLIGVALLLLLFGHGSVSFANPFTQEKGATVVTFTVAHWEVDEYLNGARDDQRLESEITQTDLILGFEHGITDRFTLVGSVPWSSSERDAAPGEPTDFDTNDGASDARLGFKLRLAGGEAAQVALLVTLKWPGDYEPDVINSPGDGNFDAEALLSVGRQLGRWTVSGSAGYRARSGDPEDEIVARLEASYLAGSRSVLFLSGEWVDSDGGLQITPETGPLFPFSRTEEDFTRLSGGLLWSFGPRVSAFGALSQTVEGRNTALGTQTALGVVLSFE